MQILKTPRESVGSFGEFVCCSGKLFKLKGACVESVVLTLLFNEFIVAASLNNSAFVQNHDDVGILDCGKSVSNDEYCSAVH